MLASPLLSIIWSPSLNTKIYKTVHLLAVELLKANEADDANRFNELYSELEKLCEDNKQDVINNHPVQWETLADFTEDGDVALDIYMKALAYAEAIDARDYEASICYSCAQILLEKDDKEAALAMAVRAKKVAAGSPDKELIKDINRLLAQFKE